MELKITLEYFFMKYKKPISIESLIKKLEIGSNKIDALLDNLYELEKDGKIMFENNTYIHVPQDFYFKHGIVRKSKSEQFYIKTSDKKIITIKHNDNLKEGDTVFVSRIMREKDHPKNYLGKVERIVKREEMNNNNCIIQGIIKRDGNNFYISNGEIRYYIPKEQLNTAFEGDRVNIKLKNNVGSVVNIIKRYFDTHVFQCVNIHGTLKWKPFNNSSSYFDLDSDKYKEGDTVVAQIKNYKLVVIQQLKNQNLMDKINALVIDYGFEHEFKEKLLKEATKAIQKAKSADLSDRRDLRKLETITIDPKDAADLDDAISLEYDNNIYHLYVHSANPTHYIKFQSILFEDAFKRCFSVYPTDGVRPMLAEAFCKDVCSLNESGDKLAITCRMDINLNGDIINFEIFKSIIRNNKQMDYDSVNLFLDNPNPNHQYFPFKTLLFHLKDLSKILQQKRMSRGSIIFERGEKEFILDKEKNIKELTEIVRGEAQEIVENCMLLKNSTIASFAYYLGLPFIYRNHDCPTVQKSNNLQYNLKQNGYFIQKISNIQNPVILQQFLTNLLKGKNKEERKNIFELILKSMNRAYYSSENSGHYGLALDCYGTFTSPARKISDFINHMVIEEFLTNGIESSKIEEYRTFIKKSCEYISARQKDADLLEQAIFNLMLTEYSEKLLGTTTTAIILFINKKGIYIKDEHGLTGIIPITKNMQMKNNSIYYKGYEYRVNEKINVSLLKKTEAGLIFEILTPKESLLVKKKKC